MNLYGGIDIGKNGGIAVIDDKNNIVLLEEFPIKYTTSIMFDWHLKLLEYADDEEMFCVKEEPVKKLSPELGGSYGRGITIGKNCGMWEYWLDSCNIDWIDKYARTWQKIFPEFMQKGEKERSYNAAVREIPACKELVIGPRQGIKDGLTDSILIAIFCRLLVTRRMFK